jgi:hypothetical protein
MYVSGVVGKLYMPLTYLKYNVRRVGSVGFLFVYTLLLSITQVNRKIKYNSYLLCEAFCRSGSVIEIRADFECREGPGQTHIN